jgi:hypothetical protein
MKKITTLCCFIISISTGRTQTEKIQGLFQIYDKKDPVQKIYMTIIPIDDQNFIIKGYGWSGEGMFDGEKGYYDWQLNDSYFGHTDFRLLKDGRIKGRVENAPSEKQPNPLEWVYLGKKCN